MNIRLDWRGIILGTWITILITTIATSIVVNANDDLLPSTIRDATGIIVGHWVAAILCGAIVVLIGWGGQTTQENILNSASGYFIGTSIRLVFLNRFLPVDRNAWNLLTDILTLQSLNSFPAFLMLVLFGGGLLVSLMALVAFYARAELDLDLPTLIDVRPDSRLLTTLPLLMLMFMATVLLLGSYNEQSGESFIISNTSWLTLPISSMLLMAIFGALVGLLPVNQDRTTATVGMYLAAVIYVTIALLLDAPVAMYDPLNIGIDPNNVTIGFLFFYIGAPVIGALAAYAMQNLLQAYRNPSLVESE